MYSKYLFKIKHFNKALYVLRIQAKALPFLPCANIPYCIALQNAETASQLIVAYTCVNSGNYAKKKRVFNVKAFTDQLIQDNFDDLTTFNKYIENRLAKIQKHSKFSSLMIDVDLDDDNQIPLPSPTPVDNPLFEFYICSKPKFLYYIAKFSLLLKKNIIEAQLALCDYLELLKYEKNKGKADKESFKAKLILQKLSKLIKND